MNLLRRFLSVVWTFAAAMPFAAPAEAHGQPGVVGVSAPGRGPRPESGASLGAVRIGLGESVVRDLKTPFVATPGFQLILATRVTRSDSPTVRRSVRQSARRIHRARAPPVLT